MRRYYATHIKLFNHRKGWHSRRLPQCPRLVESFRVVQIMLQLVSGAYRLRLPKVPTIYIRYQAQDFSDLAMYIV